jgi:hypothetical protein
MIEPERIDVVGLPPRLGNVVHGAENRCGSYWVPLRLTISVQKIDLLLAEIQKDIEDLLGQMMNLKLVQTQLADYQNEHGDEKMRVPYIHTHPAPVNVRSDS